MSRCLLSKALFHWDGHDNVKHILHKVSFIFLKSSYNSSDSLKVAAFTRETGEKSRLTIWRKSKRIGASILVAISSSRDKHKMGFKCEKSSWKEVIRGLTVMMAYYRDSRGHEYNFHLQQNVYTCSICHQINHHNNLITHLKGRDYHMRNEVIRKEEIIIWKMNENDFIRISEQRYHLFGICLCSPSS
jgi:hypothetical protein